MSEKDVFKGIFFIIILKLVQTSIQGYSNTKRDVLCSFDPVLGERNHVECTKGCKNVPIMVIRDAVMLLFNNEGTRKPLFRIK